MHIPVADGNLTQRWGYTGLASNGPYYDNRFSPPKYYPSGFHTGIDLAAPQGTRVRNMEHGVVHIASWNGCRDGACWGVGGGYVVVVKHNSTPVYTSHAHMMRLLVKQGQPVHRGQALGILDTAGYATGPHDHASLWIRGLWWSSNHAYTLDPWSAIYGSLRTSWLLKPASCAVPLSVHLRAGPGLSYSVVARNRQKTVLPVFKNKLGGAVPGFSSRLWRLVWYGRWAWVYAPLADMIRTAPVTDDILEEAGAIPLDKIGGGEPHAGHDESLTVTAPHPSDPLDDPEPDDAAAWHSRSLVAHLDDAEDAF